MIDPTIWMEEEDKREFYETLASEAQEGEIVEDGTGNRSTKTIH